jgi:AcrR family transcriptional regulator
MTMAERWTRERRLEHTRSLLLDAAEEVFGEKGFTQATLDDIAQAAGFTKGAIYKHFGAKEDLFLAVSDRYWHSYFDNFAEVLSTATEVGAPELDKVAQRWRQLTCDRSGAEHAALGYEFTLYLLRNPEARERVAAKRLEVAEALAKFIVENLQPVGGTLLIPAATFAHLLIATNDSIVLGSRLDDVDLYRPILEMYLSVIKLP